MQTDVTYYTGCGTHHEISLTQSSGHLWQGRSPMVVDSRQSSQKIKCEGWTSVCGYIGSRQLWAERTKIPDTGKYGMVPEQ